MNSKEIGFLFQLAVSCALADAGESDILAKQVMSIVLKHIDLVDTRDIMRMYLMIHSYFNSDYGVVLADSISVEDFIKLYENPRKMDNYKAFSDLLLEELEKRTNE